MTKFVRFSLLGLLNTIVTTLTYWLALKVGISPNLSYFLSFLLGTINSIWLNTHWTFKVPWRSRKVWFRGLTLYLGVAITGSLIIPTVINIGIPVQDAQLALIPFTLVINFGMSKSWVFARQD